MFDIRTITFVDCADHYHQALFWSEVTGFQEDPDDPNHPDDPESRIVTPDGISLLFMPPPDGVDPVQLLEGKTVKNRLHLDLIPTERSRDEEVTRLLGIGARLVADHREPDGTGWVVFADPEGNEFCVERSARERGLS
jgi:hypothetical protein